MAVSDHRDSHSTAARLERIQDQPERVVKLADINVDDYTIGWIAALPLEAQAAELVLDQDYQRLIEVPLGDTNQYALGTIGEHKIVLAVMPDGEYGKSSALSVATHMLRSFPNIRVGFMVGVAGAAPTKANDIRMGDVVVGRKGDGEGGVFEFDYGRKHQAKPFQHTSHLNSTPVFVMTALASLKAAGIGPREISEDIRATLADKRIQQDVRSEFERPSEEFDILFESTVVHNVGQGVNPYTVLGAIISLLALTMLAISSIRILAPWGNMLASVSLAAGVGVFVKGTSIEGCKNIFFKTTKADDSIPDVQICRAFCQTSHTNPFVRRKTRDPTRVPEIHYGLIASSDQLMKDALYRDKLAKEYNVLCFEMEAAGLMNRFPCMNVRGICDYADSHKNKKWQKYAALAAAVYAKRLIKALPVQQTKNEPRLVDAIARVENTTHEILSDTKQILSRTDQLVADNLSDKVVEWLAAPESSTKQKDVTEKRLKSTCHWLLQLPKFTDWKLGKSTFLWLHGKSGAGKSTLCSAVIDNLEQENHLLHDVRTIYFYFDFRDPDNKQSFEKMLRSLIRQLSDRDMNMQGLVEKAFIDHNNGNRHLLAEELISLFKDMVLTLTRVYIIIDALDECITRDDVGSTMGILSWIQDIVNNFPKVSLMVSSQLLDEIPSRIRNWSPERNEISAQSDSASDIKTYIHNRLRESHEFDRWKDPHHARILDNIEVKLTEEAHGMFRWVTCQLDQLKKCLDPDEIDKALKSLPPTLDETYLRILKAIPTQHKRKTIRVLQLLVGARRSLTIAELVDAIAVDTDSEPYFDPVKRMPKFEEIAQFCSSLVEVVSREALVSMSGGPPIRIQYLELAHSSVKRFLTPAHLDDAWAPSFRSTTVHASIATVCLCYTISLDKLVYRPWVASARFPFETYSAEFWPDHAIAAGDTNDILLSLALELFLRQEEPYKRWWTRTFSDIPTWYSKGNDPPTALYAACRIGWVQLVMSLLETGADPNYDDANYASPAYAACRNGNKDIVQALISKGADFSRCESPDCGIRCGPLEVACDEGHFDVVSIILDHLHKSDITSEAWNEIYKQTIRSACQTDDPDLIQMLLTDLLGNKSFTWDTKVCNPLMAAVLASGACLHIILDHLNDVVIDTQTWFELLQGGFKFTHPHLNAHPMSPALHETWKILKTQADRLGFVLRGKTVFKNFSDSEGTIT